MISGDRSSRSASIPERMMGVVIGPPQKGVTTICMTTRRTPIAANDVAKTERNSEFGTRELTRLMAFGA
jgi:hypothetical protein